MGENKPVGIKPFIYGGLASIIAELGKIKKLIIVYVK